NGGRCIVAYVVTNFWIVNNTCFKNDLDTSESAFGSFEPNDSHDGYLINNIAVAYTGGHPPYEQGGTVTNVHYYADLFFGAANNYMQPDTTDKDRPQGGGADLGAHQHSPPAKRLWAFGISLNPNGRSWSK